MADSQFFTLKEVKLNNNCPECFSTEGLELTYRQKFKETPFYRAITDETINEMHCSTCETQIFPIMWTDDIERVVAYQARALNSKPNSVKLKPLSWIIIILSVLLFVGIVLFFTGIVSI